MKLSPRYRLLVVFLCCALSGRSAQEILPRLVAGNDELIARARAVPVEASGFGSRGEAVRLLVYACGYAAPSSRFHLDATLLPEMEAIAAQLAAVQHPSGLFDVGNLESPPDTGFMLEALALAQALVERTGDPVSAAVQERLRALIRAAGDGVATGGVHTPNHRWGVCAALAAADRVQPDPRYRARIAAWLAEGIDQDADGQYAERSPAYSAKVVNPALLTLAEAANRPDLVEHVRRNLALTWWLTEPSGEIVTLASRRQDQRPGAKVTIAEYYLPARWLAVHRGDERAAAIAAWIERDFVEVLVSGAFDPNWPLPHLLLEPALAGPLPRAETLPGDFAVHLPATALGRIRCGTNATTISGGSDHAAGLGVGSGLAMNPTFFTFRKGAAQVALRLTPAFFGTGFFYSQGLEKNGDTWRLHERREVAYYQPLPEEYRRADGDYELTADGRFFSKLDFPHRPRQVRTVETEILATEKEGGWELAVNVTGQPGVPVTLELAFAGEGQLQQVTPLADLPTTRPASWLRRGGGGGRAASDTTGAFVLKEGTGRFTVGADTIEFGPGRFTQPPGRMEGEDYTWVNGSLRAEGQRVYLTGVTPFRHVLRLR